MNPSGMGKMFRVFFGMGYLHLGSEAELKFEVLIITSGVHKKDGMSYQVTKTQDDAITVDRLCGKSRFTERLVSTNARERPFKKCCVRGKVRW